MLKKEMIVSPENSGLRLDLFLAQHLRDFQRNEAPSRSSIQKLITSGGVKLNGRTTKSGARLKADDLVELYWLPPEDSPLKPEPLPLNILYEDEDCIVLNKSPGMVVHPAAGVHSGTLVHALLHHCPDLPGIGGERRPGIVHRLDKDTSGVMVVVKSQNAFCQLSRQFKDRLVLKEYMALVWGEPKETGGVIIRPIGRHRTSRKKMSSLRSVSRSREAVTEWQLEDSFELESGRGPERLCVSLMRIRPRTGRTHQIRVHLADEDYPVVGDRVYGGGRRGRGSIVPEIADFPRQALHAEKLGFIHPRTGLPMEFRAPLSQDMQELLDTLKEATSGGRFKKGVDN
jgi:23S rRNA pseudouridine1911/1915/1917 synthase